MTLFVSLLSVAPVFVVQTARAQGPQDQHATAERLFDEGRKLLADGKLDDACAKLEASEAAESAVGTLLNLGECNERRGRFASAWDNYQSAVSLAAAKNDARADFARKKSDAVRPRIASTTVAVVEPLAPAPLAPRSPDIWEPVAPPPRSGDGTLVRTLGWVGIAAGGAALAFGGYSAFRAHQDWSDAGPHCNGAHVCDDTGYALNDDARRNGNIATVAVTSGLVLAAAGTLAVLFAPRSHHE